MASIPSDKKILAILTEKIGDISERVTYDDRNYLIIMNLSELNLSHLPSEVSQLTNLQELNLENNQLSHLPPEIVQLNNLQKLSLDSNQLSQLPPEISQLSNLQELSLNHNQLSQLPPEIGRLSNLQTLSLLENHQLLTPPPEVVTGGTSAIIDFLQELHKDGVIRYEAKLLVVGEGGTGKTSLLKSLRNEAFDQDLSSTHGIDVNFLKLHHPSLFQTDMLLNTWDFGGQHIYHATHQFFLTKRSLYIVVWNARLGVEQGRLHFWLETIKALAPDAPVLLVATHTDERAPDINFQSYQEEYPQLIGSFSVSNKNKSGLHELKEGLAHRAASIKLMGQPWPRRWLEVEQQLLSLSEHHIDARTYLVYCSSNKVDVDIAMGTLGNYLHDLGKILFFRDDPVLVIWLFSNPIGSQKPLVASLLMRRRELQMGYYLTHRSLAFGKKMTKASTMSLTSILSFYA